MFSILIGVFGKRGCKAPFFGAFVFEGNQWVFLFSLVGLWMSNNFLSSNYHRISGSLRKDDYDLLKGCLGEDVYRFFVNRALSDELGDGVIRYEDIYMAKAEVDSARSRMEMKKFYEES